MREQTRVKGHLRRRGERETVKKKGASVKEQREFKKVGEERDREQKRSETNKQKASSSK